MKSLSNDLVKVSFSNLIVLIYSIVNGLYLPYVLSIDNYANLKTYALYASFIGLLHFGFVDGINIKYGGKKEENVNVKKFDNFHVFFIFFQLIFVVLALVVGYIINSKILLLLGLAILPVNLQAFFLFFYQALGNFKTYSIATILSPLISLSITLVLVYFKFSEYYYYVISGISGYLVSSIYLEYKHQKFIRFKKTRIIKLPNVYSLLKEKENKMIFKSGIFIVLGNILFGFYYDLGRWITKIYFENIDFANYSLGISLIGFILIFVNALDKTFYPHLFHSYSAKIYSEYKSILYVAGSFSLLSYFLIEPLVQNYLSKYSNSLPITAILLSSVPGILIIKSIYLNVYKILKREKLFMIHAFRYLIISIVIFFCFLYFFQNINGIAFGSVLTIYIWALFPSNDEYFSFYKMLKELLYITCVLTFYYFVIYIQISIKLKFIILLAYLLIINLLFYKKNILSLLKKNKV